VSGTSPTLLNNLAKKKKCNLNLEAVESNSPVQAAAGNSTQSPQNAASQAPAQALKADPLLKPMTVTEIQKQLLALGYQVGTADGVMGKRTVDALKKFQQDNNLPRTGQADYETMGKLRQKIGYTSAK
jgi:peptidoglycan hydrolase-like protein with peptidoglycan-binding domain